LEQQQNRRQAISALVDAMRHRDPAVRRRAAGVLDNLDWKTGAPDALAWYFVAKDQWQSAEELKNASVPALANAMKGRMAAVRRKAAGVLDHLEWEPASYSIRAYYFVAVDRWDDATALSLSGALAIVNALDDEDIAVRSAATDALFKIGADAIPALAAALRDSKDPDVRQAAAKVISAVATGLPGKRKWHAPTLFFEAIPALTSVVLASEPKTLLQSARALADIAETMSGSPDVARIFQGAIDTLRAVLRDQRGIVRAELDVVVMRIHRAATGKERRFGFRPGRFIAKKEAKETVGHK
jgi:hypothetical protein